MAPSAPHTFKGVTPERYAQLVEQAKASGINLSGNQGTASKYGIEVAWEYSPEAQQLTFQCLKVPFFMSVADVESRMRSLVESTA